MKDPLDPALAGNGPSDTDGAIDADGDADDPVPGTAGLPEDVLNDDLDDFGRPDPAISPFDDTDVDAKVVDLEDEPV